MMKKFRHMDLAEELFEDIADTKMDGVIRMELRDGNIMEFKRVK